jgi:hypothetical protein
VEELAGAELVEVARAEVVEVEEGWGWGWLPEQVKRRGPGTM